MLTPEAAYHQQGVYRANEAIRAHLDDTPLIAIVGATAVGKNFLMNESGLPIVGTLTSRAPRSDDNPDLYTYTETESFLREIEAGEIVQYGVSLPSTIYGSQLSNYKLGQPNIADIWHDAVEPLTNKGFKSIRSVSVLTPKAQWLSQLRMRVEGQLLGLVEARLSEAKHSIRWTLAKHLAHAADHLVLINSTTNLDQNLSRLNEFAAGKPVDHPDDDTVIETAREMGEVIDIMYGRLGA